MKFKNIIYALLILLIFCGCNSKNDEKEKITYYVVPELAAEYFAYKGSYWIYENQLLQLDSVVITSATHYFHTISCPRCDGSVIYEFFLMNYCNYSNNVTYNQFLFSRQMNMNGVGEDIGWASSQPILLYNWNINQTFRGATVAEKFDSLVILDKLYYNVTKMSISVEEQHQKEFEYNTDLYFAPNIGLVKKVIYDTINGTEILNLKRYNVEQE